MNRNTTPETARELPESYEPSTFSPMALPQMRPADGGLQSKWGAAVQTCNAMHEFLGLQQRTAQDAAKKHLFASLSLGCLLYRMKEQAAQDGIAVKALFADYKGPERAKEHAMEISGGGIGFTYVTGLKYIRVYQEHYRRMQEASSPQEAARIIADHAAMLMSGGYADPEGEIATLWGPYITSDNLRQALLELAPDKPATNLAETLQKAEGAAVFASWDEQREKLCQDFGGLFDNLDTYIARWSTHVTAADREAMAKQLEDAAARLRAQRTQKDLPGLTDGNK